MKYIIKCSLILLSLGWVCVIYSQDNPRKAVVLQINDAIGPATAEYVEQGLNAARNGQVAVLIVQLDTPGGLDTAMRDIIRNVIASPVPVIMYVSPSGARAASAGTYMLYASHIAAMSPGTNLGAATPVRIGGLPEPAPAAPDGPGTESENDTDKGVPTADAMTNKMVNDAVAYIRSLAEMRGRNPDWAELAVREAHSLSAEQALEQDVIDVIAADLPDLLRQIDGMTVTINGSEQVLQTTDLAIEYMTPDWRNRLLSVITNPNVAYILMLLAVYGLFFELANPGYVLPGVIGAISLLLALYALQLLPVNYAGLGLICLGIAFMVVELFMPSFGALGIGGIIAFVFGSVILFDTEGGGMAVSIPVIVAVSVISAGFFFIAVRSSVTAFRRPVVSGREDMLGSIGEVMEDFENSGRIFVHGESWQAESVTAMRRGDKAMVTGIKGLILQIVPVEEMH